MKHLLVLLLSGSACIEVVHHGIPVPLTVNVTTCGPTTRVDGATLTFRVTRPDAGELHFEYPFAAPPASLVLPPADDLSIFVTATSDAGVVTARGSAVHLVVGDAGVQRINLFPAGEFTRDCGALQVKRFAHTATRLADGAVLIVGGYDSSNASSSAMEVLRGSRLVPVGDLVIVTPGASQALRRAHHTATLAPFGQVIVAGGEERPGEPSSLAVFIDPSADFATGLVAPIQALPRARHTAALIRTAEGDDELVLVGGTTTPGASIAGRVERLSLRTLQVSSAGVLPDARYAPAIGALGQDLLVAGGIDDAGVTSAWLEVLPRGDAIHSVRGALHTPRADGALASVGERALLGGGVDQRGALLSTTEWLSADLTVTDGPTISGKRGACAVSLGDRVLFVGGLDGFGQSVLADVVFVDGGVTHLPFPGAARTGQACVALDDGTALVIGGRNDAGVLGDVWHYVPE